MLEQAGTLIGEPGDMNLRMLAAAAARVVTGNHGRTIDSPLSELRDELARTRKELAAITDKINVDALLNVAECPICQEYMTRPVVTVNCGHAFCAGCLYQWLEACYERWKSRYLSSAFVPLDRSESVAAVVGSDATADGQVRDSSRSWYTVDEGEDDVHWEHTRDVMPTLEPVTFAVTAYDQVSHDSRDGGLVHSDGDDVRVRTEDRRDLLRIPALETVTIDDYRTSLIAFGLLDPFIDVPTLGGRDATVDVSTSVADVEDDDADLPPPLMSFPTPPMPAQDGLDDLDDLPPPLMPAPLVYGCPFCRKVMTDAPREVFILNKLVECIKAPTFDEQVHAAAHPLQNGRGEASDVSDVFDWNVFF